MIRSTLLACFVIVLSITALRNWYLALCGLVLLTVFTQHPDMPSAMLGVQGLNPWNFVFLIIAACWLAQRRRAHGALSPPPRLAILFGLYTTLIIGSGIVAAADVESIQGPHAAKFDLMGVIVNTIINPLKYLAVGVMFFDGARTRSRQRMGIIIAVMSGLAYALLMLKSLRGRVFTIDFEDARRLTDKLIGLFANDLGELLAFTIWAALATVALFTVRWQKAAWIGAVVAAIPPFLALKSRAGFVAFCAAGLVLGAVRWRKILILLPIAALGTIVFVPSVRERMLTGVEAEHGDHDWDELSAGRTTNIWPPTVTQILESPVFGHGRLAILRENCYEAILDGEGRVPTHPHNSYLEMLLDGGLVGLAIVLVGLTAVGRVAWKLLFERTDVVASSAGATALIAIVTELTAGISGSSFFPSQSAVPYLCLWGLVLRCGLEKAAADEPARHARDVSISWNPPVIATRTWT